MSLLQSLPLHKQLFKALEKLTFTEATAVQEQAIPPALAGKDLMVSAQTGSGKTAAFLLPILQRMLTLDSPKSGTRALILLPTRELALQTQKHFEQLAAFTYIKSGLIIGGEAFKHQIATLRKNPEVLIATPGRLVEHLERGTPDFSDLEILVLDEADRMLDMGFAIDMHTIAESCNKQRQNLLFSATLNHKELGRIKATFKNPEFIEVDSHRQQHRQITQQVGCIHGEIPQSGRKYIMNQFRQDSIEVLVATDLAARGLDINDVDLVINFSIAQSGDDHIHRIGRTGRAGKEGKAITIIDSNEWNQMSSIERYLKIRFEHRVIQGLKAKYSGPKNVKKSGKAAGTKKKKNDDKKVGSKKTSAKKLTQKKMDQKKTNAAKPKRPKENDRQTGSGDGFDVLIKRK